MKQSGRISILMLLSLISVIAVSAILLFSRESLTSVGTRFMEALQHHDVDTLTKMTLMKGESEESIRKKWDQAVNVSAKYYVFFYNIEGATQASPTTGSVRMKVIKDADHPGAYDELMELPMTKVGDEWKVDVRAIDHEMYPGLPR